MVITVVVFVGVILFVIWCHFRSTDHCNTATKAWKYQNLHLKSPPDYCYQLLSSYLTEVTPMWIYYYTTRSDSRMCFISYVTYPHTPYRYIDWTKKIISACSFITLHWLLTFLERRKAVVEFSVKFSSFDTVVICFHLLRFNSTSNIISAAKVALLSKMFV